MKSAYVLHGCLEEEEFFSPETPSASNSGWLPWLQKQLLLKGYLCQTPEMPTPFHPVYTEWKRTLDNYPMDPETTLIAHSCGCGFLLRFLAENAVSTGRVVLVAPWLDLRRQRGEFLDFRLEPTLSSRIADFHVIHALDDKKTEVQEAVLLLRKAYPDICVHTFPTGGHFSAKELGGEAFPQLLEIVTA